MQLGKLSVPFIYKGEERIYYQSAPLTSVTPIINGKEIDFIYQGDELIYPAYATDGLVLHYDFSRRSNNDSDREIIVDLSGTGQHGHLQNFNYTSDSGYTETGNGLRFDGVDDHITVELHSLPEIRYVRTIELIASFHDISGIRFPFHGSGSGLSAKTFSSGLFRVAPRNLSTSGRYNIDANLLSLEESMSISISMEDNGKYELYKNGELELSSENSLGFDTLVESFVLGSSTTFSNNSNFTVHSFRIYNKALTSDEVRNNYKIDRMKYGINK